jgi:hypothetical protein
MNEMKRNPWLILATSCLVITITWVFVKFMGVDEYIKQSKRGHNAAAIVKLN